MDQALDEANSVKNLTDFEIYASKIEWLLSFAMSVAKVSVQASTLSQKPSYFIFEKF